MNLLPASSTVKMEAVGSSAMLVNSLWPTQFTHWKTENIIIPKKCGALIFKLLSDYTELTLQSTNHQNTNDLQYMHT